MASCIFLNDQDIFNENLIIFAKNLKIAHHWDFEQDNDPKSDYFT